MARFRAIWIGARLIAFIMPATGSVSSAGFACADVLRMHGMLRKAAGTCGFSACNPAIVDRAHACYDALGSHQGAAEATKWSARSSLARSRWSYTLNRSSAAL